MAELRTIDVTDLRTGDAEAASAVADEIGRACRDLGFFVIEGHDIDEVFLAELDEAARRFFALGESAKQQIEMVRQGSAWRGWFPVGNELTAGVPDMKEGLYFGSELPPTDPRVVSVMPLHGSNVFPTQVPELRDLVLRFLDVMTALGHDLMKGVALALGFAPDHFRRGLTADPTVLFRIFHYPATAGHDDAWGVGEHTDYGLLTLLRQDDAGGLEVKTPSGWTEVTPQPGTFVCNIGDMLEQISGGTYRSTPHRVRRPVGDSAVARLSFPFFFDPSWNAEVPGLGGVYGDYLTAKVARVFPDLFNAVGGRLAEPPGSQQAPGTTRAG